MQGIFSFVTVIWNVLALNSYTCIYINLLKFWTHKKKKNFTSIFYMHLIQSKMNCQIKLRIGFSWNQYHLDANVNKF